jgi:hypothetical protein
MGWRSFFARQSDSDEQGSFCDADSTIHYDNVSRNEALDTASKFEENLDGVDIRANTEPSRLPEASRFNTTIMEVDERGGEAPMKARPGG